MPSDGSFIVRLQHLFGSAENVGTLSAPSTVDLAAVFCGSGQTIAQVQEVSMSANQKLTDIHHWRWRRRGDGTVYREQQEKAASLEAAAAGNGLIDGSTVVMQPLSTRTFIVTVNH